jgi:hypothetical protein
VPLPDDHSRALQTVVLKVQEQTLDRRWRYYQGRQDRIWATPKLQETFRSLADSFVENYCGVAINARVSRLQVEGWDGDERAERIWTEAGLPQRQDVMFRWGLTYGISYLIVQDDQIAVNPPVLAYSQPDPNDWLRQAWAGKAWLDIDTGKWHAVLWDEDNLYRYRADGGVVPYSSGESLTMYSPAGADFVLEDVESHKYGQVPVIPMEPFGYGAAPLLDVVKPVQDKINKLAANKFVAAEFGAFKQRVFFTRQELDPYDVQQQPDHAIVLDPGDSDARASVQELSATDIGVFDAAKEKEIDAFFTMASLPRHMRNGVNAQLSGEAMKIDEAPFLEALHDHQREFGEAMVAAMALLDVNATPIWRDLSPRDEFRNAQTTELLVRSGLPWQVAANLYMGMTPEEIAEAEATINMGSAAQASAITAQTNAFLQNPFIAQQQANLSDLEN